MRAAFGKAIGTAARVDRNQTIIVIEVSRQHVDAAKYALNRAAVKLPSPCYITVDGVSG